MQDIIIIFYFCKKNIMKIFKVSIDNNPGGWKSGEDPYMLVIANDKDEAIEKVKNGWGDKWEYNHKENDGIPVIIYTKKPSDKGYNIVTHDSEFRVSEIRFEGYDVHIKNERKAKLDRIDKHIERNDI